MKNNIGEINGGIYVHIPFCRNKCLYCDFYSGGLRIADWDVYTGSLLNELQSRIEEIDFNPTTLYIGGGTPSLIPSVPFHRLIKGIREIANVKQLEEFTIEVNPEDVEAEKIRKWKDEGVDRVSVGVQTLNDQELKTIGRRHTAKVAMEALTQLKQNFDNISVDIIFGLPGQTLESYKDSLHKIIEFAPAHLSCYSLMLETGTALTHLVESGKITLPPENEWIEMYHLTNKLLRDNGYQRYEISNYALPRRESRHNSSYWNGKPYIGLGPGAHSYDGKTVRRANPCRLKEYIDYFKSPSERQDKFYNLEILGDMERMEEMIMTRLRTTQGLDLEELRTEFGEDKLEKMKSTISKYLKSGNISLKDSHLAFTEKGFLISDSIMSELI